MNMFKSTGRNLLAVGFIGAIALAGGARAASIGSPGSNAGQGVNVVAGYTVSDVHYSSTLTDSATLNQTVDQVSFKIARAGTNTNLANFDGTTTKVFVQLRKSSATGAQTSWYSCALVTASSVTTATCDTSSVAMTLADVESLSVIAYDMV